MECGNKYKQKIKIIIKSYYALGDKVKIGMMIFKYCVWPSVSKDEDTKHSPVIKTCNDVEIIKKSLFHCCPCAFRRRQPIDIETNADLLSINTELPVLVPTPVISLTPNQCNELYVFKLFFNAN